MRYATILTLVCVVNVTVVLAQEAGNEFRWTDGYLERDYTEEGAVDEVDGIPGMFDKCVAVSTTILEDKSGYISASGVGDSKGNCKIGFANWNGVGTFPNLNVPDGGVIVYVKIKGKSIGFKVGDGDKKSSEILHSILADRIKSMDQRWPRLSEKQTERVSKIRDTFAFTNPPPLDSFLWQYRRSEDPERKISVHEAMARTLKGYSKGKELSIDGKKELLSIIQEGVNSSPDEAIRNLKLKTITESQAREVLGMLAKELPSKESPTNKSRGQ